MAKPNRSAKPGAKAAASRRKPTTKAKPAASAGGTTKAKPKATTGSKASQDRTKREQAKRKIEATPGASSLSDLRMVEMALTPDSVREAKRVKEVMESARAKGRRMGARAAAQQQGYQEGLLQGQAMARASGARSSGVKKPGIR